MAKATAYSNKSSCNLTYKHIDSMKQNYLYPKYESPSMSLYIADLNNLMAASFSSEVLQSEEDGFLEF